MPMEMHPLPVSRDPRFASDVESVALEVFGWPR
jgi:hypothetical protein